MAVIPRRGEGPALFPRGESEAPFRLLTANEWGMTGMAAV
jgi:hypothetical protein